MQRFRVIKDAKAATEYYGKSDSGSYYLDAKDLRREIGGKAAAMLGLSGQPDFDQFSNLLNGLDPHTGEQLTALLVPGRIAGWDITTSIPKGVTVALEHGDTRIHDALWEAGREAMAELEKYVTTRERKGGAQGNRVTGNMVWFGFEHPETRPAKEDGMPDPDRHIHFVIPNITYDPEEQQFKAIKFRPIMDMRKFFDRSFDMRLASKLTDLGYEIGTKYKADEKGGAKYYSWDINGIPDSVTKKFSRRTGEVEAVAAELDVTSAVGKDKLGATSRMHKRQDMTLEDYRKYWHSRVTPKEAAAISDAIETAKLGVNPKPNRIAEAVAYALEHHFERKSVVAWNDIAVTAMEKAMGAGRPDDVLPEAIRQGVLLKDGEATTRQVLAQEDRIVSFARDGRGTCEKMGTGKSIDERLSEDQKAAVQHIWNSHDRVIMVEGDAGTGKTETMQVTIPGVDKPGVFLAPSASASRDTLREKGFTNADTIKMFLSSPKFREQARGGYIYIDEAPLATLNDIDQVFAFARSLDARVILQGDRKQNQSPQRGGLFELLDNYAGLEIARLTSNWRQRIDGYKQAVNDIAKGDPVKGLDQLDKMGCVISVDGNTEIVNDYMNALASKKSVLVVAPTHSEGREITGEIRHRLKDAGVIGSEDREFPTLEPVRWTEAQKGDLSQYDGSEVIYFHRKSGTFSAGDLVPLAKWKPSDRYAKAEHFSVYRPAVIQLAAGDSIRITANGKSKAVGKESHKLNNGAMYQVKGFSKDGEIVLTNGWVIGKGFYHLNHGYTTTSFAAQGKTVDRVLIAMGKESSPAINAETFYVAASRGRYEARIYSDMSRDDLREAIQRNDPRKSAHELIGAPKAAKPKPRRRKIMEKLRSAYRQLRDKAIDGMGIYKKREIELGR